MTAKVHYIVNYKWRRNERHVSDKEQWATMSWYGTLLDWVIMSKRQPEEWLMVSSFTVTQEEHDSLSSEENLDVDIG